LINQNFSELREETIAPTASPGYAPGCSMLGNVNAQVPENGDLATFTDYENSIFQRLSLILTTKKLF